MPPKAATSDATHLCPYCHRYFKNLNTHWALSTCRAPAHAAQEAYAAELRAKQGHYEPDELDDSDEPAGAGMDIDSPLDDSWQFHGSTQGPGPSKQPHFISPEPSYPGGPSLQQPPPGFQEESPLPPQPSFRVSAVHEFPTAARIIETGQPTQFHHIWDQRPKDLPHYPWADAEEWSLVEWLGTAGLSKGKIDSFLKTRWVCFPLFLS
jgi:hypothetical protein